MSKPPEEAGYIRIRGARQNNLADLDLAIPKQRLTVVTGVSGSGKSSLAFDTLYAEGQRRYVESFSTYARQFLERMDRPEVDAIEGLLPAVAIEQKNAIRSARSTLGTLTELTDYLKVLFANSAVLHCEVCDEPVLPDLPGPTIDGLLSAHPGARAMITFPFFAGKGDDARVALAFLVREGFHRALVDGAPVALDSMDPDAGLGRLDVLVDRVKLDAADRPRIVEALEMAYRMGEDDATVHLVLPAGSERRELTRSRRHCHRDYPEPRPGHFSFNSPLGACETCNGFGRVIAIDMDRVVPDRSKTLNRGAIRPWARGKRAAERRWLRTFCAEAGIDMDVPFEDLPPREQTLVLEGAPRGAGRRWPGVRGWFKKLERKNYRMHVRILLARYRTYLPCTDCEGTRLEPYGRRFRLGGLSLPGVLALSVTRARAWLSALGDFPEAPGLGPAIEQLTRRLAYLDRVGVGYLSLDRAARTLSGGEVQRANLTSALGSGLVNTLFVLDEPSIGLHAADTQRLSSILAELTERDNTVVLVEHDPDVLDYADHVIELGPGPGRDGGRVVYAGPPAGLAASDAATATALAARSKPRKTGSRDFSQAPGLTIRGARAQNLADIDVHFPAGALTVLTGVSGSGKSTLLGQVLYRGVLRRRGEVTDPPGDHDAIEGLDRFSEVVRVDQSAPAASSRANPATYVKAWDAVRKRYAAAPLARERHFTAGTFSFNSGAGRCPACEGAGFERVEMQFLSDVHLTCQACEGKRFTREVLQVEVDGRSIADVLDLTVDEAAEWLGKRSAGGRRLAVLSEVGLGYLKLGQPLSTLSGGEAQRLKLAHYLGAGLSTRKRKRQTKPILFLLDEPTTGLHLTDVDRLVANLSRLRDAGHTVVVIEHHLDVIAAADHVIDLGPGGGEEGGQVVFAGPPAALAMAETATGAHLARWLEGDHPLASARATPVEPRHEPHAELISVAGARVHNLKDVSVDLPRRGRTVISGVSGSGKSSLAFDLVFAEGQRRFLDCLSPYARQYITQLSRPDADRVAGIPPTVAIEQRTSRGGARSTVANVTEIEPFLRILYARLGDDPDNVSRHKPPAQVAASALRRYEDEPEILVLAPLVVARKGYHKTVFARAAKLGFGEARVDGELRPVDPPPRLRKTRRHTIEVVVARTSPGDADALSAAIETAARLGEGEVLVGPEDGPLSRFEVQAEYDEAFVRRPTWDPRLFSARTDMGACELCAGDGELEPGLVCPACEGQRLGPVGRRVVFGGLSLPAVLAKTAPQLLSFIDGLSLGPRDALVAEGPLGAIRERATFLVEVGLEYLTLDRLVPTLSNGEAQRIRLAAQLGAHLSGVLYVLDEPTIGLHPTDTALLLRTLDRLQALDNGVLMVEHDEATIRSADILVDMGPGAGLQGGEVLVQGPIEAVLADARSLTGACLRDPRPRVRAAPRGLDDATFITLEGVSHRNLRGVDVRIPRGRLTLVTGVSGSGKSTLVHEVLAKAVNPDKGGGTIAKVSGVAGIERLARVDDKPIGKNPRSIPATYVGIWDPIRRLFAKLPEARLRGFGPSRFSFNVKGGRCDACAGQGAIKLEMSFMPDAYVSCDVCGGRRFNRQTLHIAYDGHSIHDVLELQVSDALALFERVPKIKRGLALMEDVGLGYLQLGQPSPTLSGGEAQRIKLVSELQGRDRSDTLVVLDEPSTGLHMADVPRLAAVLHRLVDAGATVVVIEHNPDLMREADWIIDMGPGAGERGGRVVYQGPFEGLLGASGSRTGGWLSANRS